MTIDLDVTSEELEKILKIIGRFEGFGKVMNCMSLEMDIVACHRNGCPLDLDGLLAADDFNLAHDVVGISNHINRETGKLERHFLPRYALPVGTGEWNYSCPVAYTEKKDRLIGLKTAIAAANTPIQEKIFRLSELKDYESSGEISPA